MKANRAHPQTPAAGKRLPWVFSAGVFPVSRQLIKNNPSQKHV
jgi:hypothetical protein